MAKRHVIALCKITTSDPDAPMEFTGQYDAQGVAVLRKTMFSFLAGDLFELDDTDPDFERLLEMEAIRLPRDVEIHAGRALEL